MSTGRKIALWAAGVLGLLVAAVVAVGFALPSRFAVERAVVIEASPAAIHALVGDLRRWPEWSPWEEADSTIDITIGERAAGVGAHQSWTGESGSGELTVTASSPATGIDYDLVFDETWRNTATVRYEPLASGTRVVWTMRGDAGSNIVGRYFGVMMDGLVGPMFERGLEKLRERVERGG